MTQNNLGNALLALGERECGTARLKEAIAAYREALKERTRERTPLDAASFGNVGVARMLPAERRNAAAGVEPALARIALRRQWAAYFWWRLSHARAIRERLRVR
jgi:hypothetical protein